MLQLTMDLFNIAGHNYHIKSIQNHKDTNIKLTYIGLTEAALKRRYGNHYAPFGHENLINSILLYKGTHM